MKPRFQTLLLEALKQFADVGYTNELDLQEWLLRLRYALERELPPDEQTRKELAAVLGTIFKRDVDRMGVQRRVPGPGVSRYTLDRIAPHLRAELDRRIFAGVDLIKLNRAAATQKTLQRFSGWVSSVPRGGSATTNLREVAGDIGKSIAQLKFERRRVAIDQGHKLSAAVAHVVAQGSGAIAAIWHDRGDDDRGYDARPEHLKRSGKMFLIRDSWAMNEALIKKGGLQYTDEIEQVAELPFCFPASTRIQYADGVRVGYRRWYSGEMTEIVTASGKTLRATPNHPILTVNGWVACGLLQEGDEVVELAQERVQGSIPEMNDDQTEPTIAQIFGFLRESGVTRRVRGSRNQFHGDGTKHGVDIVDAARELSIDNVTASAKSRDQLAFAKTYHRRTRPGALHLFRRARALLTARFVCGLNASHSPLGIATRKHDARCLPDAPNCPPGRFNTRTNNESSDSKYGGQRLHGLASFVTTTKLVSVKWLASTGQVYNLETATGFYVADGIITHNCSCWYEYVTTPRDVPAELLTAKGRAWVDGRAWVAGIGPQPVLA